MSIPKLFEIAYFENEAISQINSIQGDKNNKKEDKCTIIQFLADEFNKGIEQIDEIWKILCIDCQNWKICQPNNITRIFSISQTDNFIDNPSKYVLREEMENFLNLGARCFKCRNCPTCQSLMMLRKIPNNIEVARQMVQ